jgi:cyclopropane fatty-acyl-phospholipid synthase-like methyltransferase
MSRDDERRTYKWDTKALSDPSAEGVAPPPERKPAPDLAGLLERGRAALLAWLPADPGRPLQVADLGSADGKLAALVLQSYPAATVTLVDSQERVMEQCAQLLAGFEDRFSYVSWHPDDGDWPDILKGPFDAIISTAAIHHLAHERKRWLAAAALERLTDGGVYADFDLFRHPQAQFTGDTPAEIHDGACATLGETGQFLIDAGFHDVHVRVRSERSAHKGELALIVGRKTA